MFTVHHLLADHFRCPELGVEFDWTDGDKSPAGFFRFGDNVTCYGRSSLMPLAQKAGQPLHDAFDDTRIESSGCTLPFNPAEVIGNLRHERYIGNADSNGNGHGFHGLIRRAYYGVRPLLPVRVRKHFQRLFLAGRMDTPFPSWPVDRTVDRLLERLLALSMRAQGLERVPFIWFWPDGRSSAAIMTHDVEMPAGVRFCPALMDIDERHGFRSSFQLVPEDRYATPEPLIGEMRQRGFEVNVHDLNHDGRLYWDRKEFLRRAAKINHYARKFGAHGFRAGVLYRNLDWYDAFDFAYDMSVPNVGHLDPQAGGCCTVMPYFVGRILELPVTATQDYPLFQILGEYSIELWIQQINLIQDGYGLISFITHPDYLAERRASTTYRALLAYLARLRSEVNLWTALPGEVNEWWRARSRMRLVQRNGAWQIEGPGKERARIAYASLDGNGVRFTVETSADAQGSDAAQFTPSSFQHNA
jgi:hypothetical protein